MSCFKTTDYNKFPGQPGLTKASSYGSSSAAGPNDLVVVVFLSYWTMVNRACGLGSLEEVVVVGVVVVGCCGFWGQEG